MSGNIALQKPATGLFEDSVEAKFIQFEKRIAELEEKLSRFTAQQNGTSVIEVETPGSAAAEPVPHTLTNGDAAPSVSEPEAPTVEDDRYTTIFRQWDETLLDFKEIRAPDSTVHNKQQAEVKKGRVLTYRKTLSDKSQSVIDSDKYQSVVDWEIDIDDKSLVDELKACYDEACPGNDLSWPGEKATIYFPFHTVIWCYDLLDLRGKTDEGDDEDSARHKADIRQLLKFVRDTPPLADYFKTRDSTPDQIAFKYVWTLFPFGTEFVSSKKFLNTPQLFKVNYEPEVYDLLAEESATTWVFVGWHYDHTGSDWVKASHTFEIQSYERERPINSLDFYPIKYHTDNVNHGQGAAERLRAARLEEGQRFVEYCQLEGSKRLRSYNDALIAVGGSQAGGLFTSDDASSRGNRRGGIKRPKVKSDMIIDSQAWYQQYFELPLGDSVPALWFENDPFYDKTAPVVPEGDWIRFCPPRFFGFMVKEKVSVQLKISALAQTTPKDAQPFDMELQLEEDSKKLLRALVENHANQRATMQQMDIVAGKGNSLVILLHGGPGLGKTLTAETLAKATGKPLLTADVADIGVTPDSAESKLERHFERAARWDAILLIDEADAFLEERKQTSSPNQNALVTVMLRILEYYNGIIILTTNRLLSLDPAVQSRIHLALYFDNLKPRETMNIFKNLLERFNVDAAAQERLESWFEAFSEGMKMNGREIRNLVHSAIAVARSNDRPVTKDDFKAVHKKLREFREHLDDKLQAWKLRNQGYLK